MSYFCVFSYFHADKEEFRADFKVPPFQDCILSFLGFSDEEKANMEERTLKHGQCCGLLLFLPSKLWNFVKLETHSYFSCNWKLLINNVNVRKNKLIQNVSKVCRVLEMLENGSVFTLCFQGLKCLPFWSALASVDVWPCSPEVTVSGRRHVCYVSINTDWNRENSKMDKTRNNSTCSVYSFWVHVFNHGKGVWTLGTLAVVR